MVVGVRLRGDALGNAPPVRRIGEEEIESYGAATVNDLVDAVEPETRGNGGASYPQIVLLNGSRIADFSDIGGLPAEAVERVDVLPAEVALSYGYPVGARVLNIVLRERFRALTADNGAAFATAGGRGSVSSDWNLARVRGESRLTVDLSFAHDSALNESERDIAPPFPNSLFAAGGNVAASGAGLGAEIDPALSALFGARVTVAAIPASAASAAPPLADFVAGASRLAQSDLRALRTLLPESSRAAIGVAIARPLFSRVNATLSGRLSTSRSQSGFGRAPVSLLLPATNPFSPFVGDVGLYGLARDTLRRDARVTSGLLSGLLSGDVGLWRWSATATIERSSTVTRDIGFVDIEDVQARISAADPALNPFAAIAGLGLPADPRKYSIRAQREAIDLAASGPLAQLPAGDLLLSLAATAERLGLATRRNFIGAPESDLRRTQTYLIASLDVPLTRAADSSLGIIAINFNATARQIPRFGWLRTWGAGLRWTPRPSLSLNISYTDDDGFPTLQQIGDPIVPVPNVPVFDPVRGETVSVIRLEGGNPLLRPNNRRERKIEVIFRPPRVASLTISANYTEVDLYNPIATFPIVSPGLEAAFPNRFQRDADGRLVLVDARAISVASSHFRGLRWGLQYASQPRPGDRSPTRIGASLFHTWRFRNDIQTSDVGPVLDLLAGAAIGPRGGLPRHLIEGNARISSGPFGSIVSASWQADTIVRASADDLFYSDKPRVSAWFFLNLGQLNGASGLPSWLRAGRLTLSIENILDAHLRVRDARGVTPLAFQADYLDPLGRSVRLSFHTSIR